jgi:hypothetical protein
VSPIAEREQTCSGGAEVDHGDKERGKRIQAEMCAEPRQSNWQDQGLGRGLADKGVEGNGETRSGNDERSPIHKDAPQRARRQRERKRRENQKGQSRGENEGERHR